jgi:hypothetical protein
MEEPLVRCDGCQSLVSVVQLRKLGCCHSCGNRRYKNVQLLSEDEERQLRDKTYQFGRGRWPEGIEEFLQLFEGVEEL